MKVTSEVKGTKGRKEKGSEQEVETRQSLQLRLHLEAGDSKLKAMTKALSSILYRHQIKQKPDKKRDKRHLHQKSVIQVLRGLRQRT